MWAFRQSYCIDAVSRLCVCGVQGCCSEESAVDARLAGVCTRPDMVRLGVCTALGGYVLFSLIDALAVPKRLKFGP